MAPDDAAAVKLPRMNVPGMQTPPPPQPPGLDPMEGLKNMARDAANSARAQFAPQSPPPVAPLLGPGAGSTVLPMLQAADTYMRDKTAAAIGNAKDVPGTVAQGVQSIVDAGRAEGQRIQAIDNTQTERPGTVMGGVQNLGARIKNGLLDAGVLSPDIVSRAPILTPDQQHGVNPALPQATYSNEGRSAPSPVVAAPVAGAPAPAAPGGDKFDKQVQLASLISAQNNSRTPVSNPYEGPAAGVAPPAGGVHGSIGVEGFQKQLANIQALRTPEPQTGGVAAADTETWQDKHNREKTEKWALEDQMRALKSINPNTDGGRAQLAAMGHLISSGQSAAASRYGADASSGASMHNAGLAAQSASARDAANLQATGMQVSGQDRNSQRSANASMYGHNTHANTAMQDAMLRAQTAMQGHQVQRDTNAATNASALERTRMMVDEGRERTAAGAKESQNKLLMAGNEKLVNPLNPAEWYTRSGEKGRFVEVGMPKPKDKKAEK